MTKIRGFSIIELSISLVIIALIIAAISSASNLLSVAELNKVIEQNQKIESAYNIFKLTHNALPGDYKNAYQTFGSVTCTNVSVHSDVDGCNGDGDNTFSGSTNREGMLFWKHLVLANLVKGQFSVIASGTWKPGENVMKGVFNNSGYYVDYDDFNGVIESQNLYYLGAVVDSNPPYGAVMLPFKAYSLDNKIDDGHPLKGRVMGSTATSGATNACINGLGGENITGASAYDLSNEYVACRMVFKFN